MSHLISHHDYKNALYIPPHKRRKIEEMHTQEDRNHGNIFNGQDEMKSINHEYNPYRQENQEANYHPFQEIQNQVRHTPDLKMENNDEYHEKQDSASQNQELQYHPHYHDDIQSISLNEKEDRFFDEQNRLKDEIQQRDSFEKLGYDIQGIVNKASTANVVHIVKELFKLNLIRGRGLFCKMILKAQQGHGTIFTPVYAAMVAVVNTKFPEIGELLLHRILIQFQKSYSRRDNEKCKNYLKFIAHLVNQQVAHVVLAGQICGFLLDNPTTDSVELCVGMILECGKVMSTIAPKIGYAVFESFRSILVSGKVEKRIQYMIERLFRVRQQGFIDFPGVPPELDLIEIEDQITHEVELEDELDAQEELDEFSYDEDFEEHEERYNEIRQEILGDEEEEEEEEKLDIQNSQKDVKKPLDLLDMSNIEVQKFKRDVYLMFSSSLDHEECAFKILKSGIAEGRTMELCSMIISSCTENRAYNKFYGLLAERFCLLDRKYQESFEECFKNQYESVDDTEVNKLRNMSMFFAHLLEADVLSWTVLQHIKLSADNMSMASRIFVKILFQEIIEKLGMKKLLSRLKDEYLVSYFEGLFPLDDPKNTKFAIRFWKSSGMDELAEDLERYLEMAPKELLESDEDEYTTEEESEEEDTNTKREDIFS